MFEKIFTSEYKEYVKKKNHVPNLGIKFDSFFHLQLSSSRYEPRFDHLCISQTNI